MYVLKNQPPEGSRAGRNAVKPSLRLKPVLIALVAGMVFTGVHAATKPVHPTKAKTAGHSASNAAKHGHKSANSARQPVRATAGAANKPTGAADESDLATQSGVGSWYGNYFHGKQTASGELFNMHAFTAAHRTLPIPSYARVRNMDNGKEVIVRVNDRGPYVGRRVIDLSMAAAQKLGIHGLGRVRIEPVSADDILSGKWREEDIRPSGPSQSGEASVATVASVKVARDAGKQSLEAPSVRREALAGVLPGFSATDTSAMAPTTDTTVTSLASVEAGATVAPGPRPVEEAFTAPVDQADRVETAEATGAAPIVKHVSRVRGTASSAVALAGTGAKDSKEAKDSAMVASVLASAHPLPTPSSPTAAADASAPMAASRASAPALAVTAFPAVQGNPAPGGPTALPAPTPVVAAASAALTSPVATVPTREVSEAVAPAPPAAPATSILASVAANVVTPVLTGIARSATELKDTVVNFALSRPTQKPGTVQIDPARTSNGKGWWLQLGVFEQSANAMTFQHKVITLAPWLAPLMGVFDERGEQKLQAGPYPSREQAQQALERAREALKVNPVMVQRR